MNLSLFGRSIYYNMDSEVPLPWVILYWQR